MSTSGADSGRAVGKDNVEDSEAAEDLARKIGPLTVSGETWRALLMAVVAVAAVTAMVLQIPRALPNESDGRPTQLVELPTRVGN